MQAESEEDKKDKEGEKQPPAHLPRKLRTFVKKLDVHEGEDEAFQRLTLMFEKLEVARKFRSKLSGTICQWKHQFNTKALETDEAKDEIE